MLIPSLVVSVIDFEYLEGIEKEDSVGDDEDQRGVEGREGEVVSEDEEDQTEAPQHGQQQGQGQHVLERKNISKKSGDKNIMSEKCLT